MLQQHYRYFASLVMFCGTFVVLPMAALGQAQYNVTATALGLQNASLSSSSPISNSLSSTGMTGIGNTGTFLEFGADSANEGITQAQGNSTVTAASYGLGGDSFGAGGYAQFMCNDLVVSGPSNPAGVSIILNFVLNGQFSVTNTLNDAGVGDGDYLGSSQSTSNVSLSLGILGGNYEGAFSVTAMSDGDGNQSASDANSGLLNSYVGFGQYDFTLGPLTVPVNSSFSLSNELTVGSGWSTNPAGTGPEAPNFTGSAVDNYSLAFQSIAATLPGGYTLNSAEANIVNDVYTSPVPEPGTLSLLGAALLGAVYLRRRSANR
jgi:hypothetical protein